MRPDLRPDPEHDPLIERIAEQLREPVLLSGRVERTVLERLRTRSPAVVTPPPLRRSSPWAAAGLAAGLLAAFGLGVLAGRRGTAPGMASGAATLAAVRESRPVEFALHTSADSAVALVGDFNDWDPRATPLRHAHDGVWTATVPLRPGRYRYTFIVDGTRWRRDPAAPRALEDDFGAPTSVITVAQR